MKLYNYDQFNESKQSKEDIHSICKKYGIKNYTINDDGTVDVDGSVNLGYNNPVLTNLPLKFGKVTGSFYVDGNQLSSLEGCPNEVGSHFDCSNNLLNSLEGCPKEVGGVFNCSGNRLTSLKGCPKKASVFYCYSNQLSSLEGCPEIINRNFDCSYNKIRSVKWFPNVKGSLIIENNIFMSIFNLFPYDYWLEVVEYLNEYDVIRDGNKVVLQALELVYDELGLEVPDEIEIKGYEIV